MRMSNELEEQLSNIKDLVRGLTPTLQEVIYRSWYNRQEEANISGGRLHELSICGCNLLEETIDREIRTLYNYHVQDSWRNDGENYVKQRLEVMHNVLTSTMEEWEKFSVEDRCKMWEDWIEEAKEQVRIMSKILALVACETSNDDILATCRKELEAAENYLTALSKQYRDEKIAWKIDV